MLGGAERFEVLRTLGVGGEAVVYLARHPTTKDLVALRVLKPELESLGTLFLQRARAIAGLGHPHIVRVLETAREDELPPYVVLSYAPNGTLQEKIKHGDFTDSRSVLALMIQLAEACHFAHQRGVLHGDICPGNILFDEANSPVLTDFGGGSIPGERTGGQPPFMAAEKAAGGSDTVAIDVYSLGAVLNALLKRCPQDERHVRRGLRVAKVATAFVPAHRHESARAFAEELRRVQEDRPLCKPKATRAERFALHWRATR